MCLLWISGCPCSRPAPCISHHQITTGCVCLGRNLTALSQGSSTPRLPSNEMHPAQRISSNYNAQRLRHPCAFSPSVICLDLGNGNVQQQLPPWKNVSHHSPKSRDLPPQRAAFRAQQFTPTPLIMSRCISPSPTKINSQFRAHKGLGYSPSSEKIWHSLTPKAFGAVSISCIFRAVAAHPERAGGIILSRGVKFLLISFCLMET